MNSRRGDVLDISRFHVFDDGQEQVIKSCSSDDVPVSIGVVLDASGSIASEVGFEKNAALQFVRAPNPADEYFLPEFRNRPQVVLPFTMETDRLLSRQLDIPGRQLHSQSPDVQ